MDVSSDASKSTGDDGTCVDDSKTHGMPYSQGCWSTGQRNLDGASVDISMIKVLPWRFVGQTITR